MSKQTDPPTPPSTLRPEATLATSETRPEALPVQPVRLRLSDPTPPSLGLVPLRELVLLPGMVTPVVVIRPRSVAAVKRAARLGTPLVFVTQHNAEMHDPERDDLHDVATLGRLLRVLRFSDGSMRALIEGLRRVQLGDIQTTQPVLRARVGVLMEDRGESVEAEALAAAVQEEFLAWTRSGGKAPLELEPVVQNLPGSSRVADYVAGNLPLETEEMQKLLAEHDVPARLTEVRRQLARHRELAELNTRIHGNVQAAMDKNQREYYLKEQLRAVKEELGQYDPSVGDIEGLRARVLESEMPEEAEKEALRELERMSRMHRDGAEFTVARTFVDWLLDMPWGKVSTDSTDLDAVETILDADHTGLHKVKERILEYLSVRQLNPDGKSPILCFMGPPGVGKTSLGRSIARAMGRNVQRIALGGVKDESEIRGHRRTYVGAMPGRIVQAVKRSGSMNPVLILDEIDKVGNDFRGDPASALLEALDPEQNHEFMDHYLDTGLDLSKAMFLCTANQAETIPPALWDRMEVIEIPGYIEEEKLAIALQHLVPKVRKENGLTARRGTMSDEVLLSVIRGYTAEAGVRELERQIGKVARKIARRVVQKKKGTGAVKVEHLTELLGPQRHFSDRAERTDLPGVAVGLAWTPVGGEILFIEVTAMEGGSGKFRVTGQLGDVMKESAETALSWVRSHATRLGVDTKLFKERDLHVHFPQGAIPKDGPSAGITTIVALVSLLTGRRVNHELAMTGEITLRGKILPVGGIKEKVLAARRAGIGTVLLPKESGKDLLDIPEALRDSVRTVLIERVDDVWEHVFDGGIPAPAPSEAN
ncbi:MAG: endopeptidase La [Deltaproteobacteria bacterium]|nr:endopeptidase La [Deltaproteobacteria bacterium]